MPLAAYAYVVLKGIIETLVQGILKFKVQQLPAQ